MNENEDKVIVELQAPPAMFDLPADAPPAMPSVRGGDEVMRMHEQWRHLSTQRISTSSPFATRQLQRMRSLAHRLLGRSDHEFLADLTRAVDAVAARSDDISEQLARQQLLMQNIVESLGPELTRLRAVMGDTHDAPDR